MPPVDELELLVVPARGLAALVLAVPDRDRLLRQRLARVLGLEDELDHLPVALVQVVPVVVDVEQPVLERELAGVAGIADHVGVDGRLASLADPAAPELVVAARIERVAREVEVVPVEAVEVGGEGRDLDEVDRVPRASESDRPLVEEDVDVDRLVRLPVAALLLLLDEPHDRRVALGELALVGEVGETHPAPRRARPPRRVRRGRGSHASGFDAAAGFASLLTKPERRVEKRGAREQSADHVEPDEERGRCAERAVRLLGAPEPGSEVEEHGDLDQLRPDGDEQRAGEELADGRRAPREQPHRGQRHPGRGGKRESGSQDGDRPELLP